MTERALALWGVIDALEAAWACGALDIGDGDILHERTLRAIKEIERESIKRRRRRAHQCVSKSRRRTVKRRDATKGSRRTGAVNSVLDAESILDRDAIKAFGSLTVRVPE